MEKKHIRADYRKKRRSAKKVYRSERRELRSEYREKLEEYYETDEFKKAVNPPRRTVLEEVGNAVTHGVGSVFSIVAFALMLAGADTAAEYAGAGIYFFGLFMLFTMSCLYHSFGYGSKVKRVFRRFDYCSIYLLIGSTFAPILLCYVGGTFGIIFCAVQWTVIAVGITFIGVFGPAKLKWLHYPLYFILGWSALAFVPKMISEELAFFFFILGGGIIYSLGFIPFLIDRKVSHFLWHFFVLAGAAVHWVGIYLYIYCR